MKRRGTVLLAVMLVTALSAMVAASLLYYVQSQVSAAAAGSNGEQAYAAAMSGLERALAVLRTPDEDWQDNPEMFQNQLVCDDGVNKWYFTVHAPGEDGKTLRYGLEDESGKINLNFCPEATLRALLAARKTSDVDTNELADCLLDYLDRDNNPRPQGAEQDYYDKLANPYAIKNGSLGTLEELLLVKGFTGSVVYGNDANLNGLVEPNEQDGDETFPPDAGDGQLDRGLLGVATAVTHEPNVDNASKPRVNINGAEADLRKLDGLGLPKKTVDFIRSYRQDNPSKPFTHPSQLLGMSYTTRQVSPANQPSPPSGRGRRGGGSSPPAANPAAPQVVTITSGVTAETLPIVMDKLTTAAPGPKGQLQGLVNVNTAPVEVLRLLPGMDENLSRTIVETRGALDAEKKKTVAWLVTENLLDPAKFKVIAPMLTTRSLQLRLHCTGFGVPCGRFREVEAVVDFAGTSPRIAYLRDITRLGPPMALNVDQQEHRQ